MLGIGINVNMRTAEEVDQAWTSIRLETSKTINRNDLVVLLNKRLLQYLLRQEMQGFAVMQAEWEENHLWQGREVSLTAGIQKVDGTVLGIDRQGALRIDVAGTEKVFSGVVQVVSAVSV